MVPDTNLLDLTKTVNLSRRPAREPDWIDVFLLLLTRIRVCGSGGRCKIVIHHCVGVHDRRTREREVRTLIGQKRCLPIDVPPVATPPDDGMRPRKSVLLELPWCRHVRSCSHPYRMKKRISVGTQRTQDTLNMSAIHHLDIKVLMAVEYVQRFHPSHASNHPRAFLPEGFPL